MLDAIFRYVPEEQLKLSMVNKHAKACIDSQLARDKKPRIQTDLLTFLKTNSDIDWAVSPTNTYPFDIDILRQVVDMNDDVLLSNALKLMPVSDNDIRELILYDGKRINQQREWWYYTNTPVYAVVILKCLLQHEFELSDANALLLLQTPQLDCLHITLAISYVMSIRCDRSMKSKFAQAIHTFCMTQPYRIMLHVFAENDPQYYTNGVAMCYTNDVRIDTLARMISDTADSFRRLVLDPTKDKDAFRQSIYGVLINADNGHLLRLLPHLNKQKDANDLMCLAIRVEACGCIAVMFDKQYNFNNTEVLEYAHSFYNHDVMQCLRAGIATHAHVY